MKVLHRSFDNGLSVNDISIIKQVLNPYWQGINEVKVFGSRATESYKPYSDLDLVIFGNLTSKDLDRLATLFMESSLGIKVDLQEYNLIRNRRLIKHIDDYGKTLFKVNLLKSAPDTRN